MTFRVEPCDGTELVEVFDGKKPVAGPMPVDDVAAWIEAQGRKAEGPPAPDADRHIVVFADPDADAFRWKMVKTSTGKTLRIDKTDHGTMAEAEDAARRVGLPVECQPVGIL